MNEPHKIFKKIIQYCNVMNYNVNDILSMSDHELKLWYDRVIDMTRNETNFKILTGMSMEKH